MEGVMAVVAVLVSELVLGKVLVQGVVLQDRHMPVEALLPTI